MHDPLFKAGGELVSGLGPLLMVTPNLQGLHPLRAQASASQPAHSHKARIDVHGLLLHVETRAGDGVPFSINGRKY